MANIEAIDEEETGSSRGSFLLVGGAGLCAVLGLVYFGYIVQFMDRADPGGEHAKPLRVRLAGLRFLAGVSEPVAFDIGNTNVDIYLARQGNTLLALERTCPHQGCPVDWQQSDRQFVCPCHGSQFDALGNVVVGPSPRGLYRHQLRIEQGMAVIGGRI